MQTMTAGGWPVLHPGDSRLTVLKIPGVDRRFTGRNDALGFLVCWWFSFWNDRVEPLDGPGKDAVDEGCHAYRAIRGATSPSEHSAAAAADANWAKHPQGVPISKTFTRTQIAMIRYGVRYLNRHAKADTATWGGEWPSWSGSTAKTDGMHVQFKHGRVLPLVRFLATRKRGKRVLAANPHLKIKGVNA